MSVLFSWALDILFPIHCFRCSKPGQWLCVKCRRKSRATFINRQGVKILLTQEPAFEAAVRALYCLKYKFQVAAVQSLISMMAFVLCEYLGNSSKIILVPVPTDSRRIKQRGFDQAELLARALAEYLNISSYRLLIRNRVTKSQVGLNRAERLDNLRDIFRVVGDIPAAKIILIDDVSTTGATFKFAATTLINAGAKDIVALALFGKIDHWQPI